MFERLCLQQCRLFTFFRHYASREVSCGTLTVNDIKWTFFILRLIYLTQQLWISSRIGHSHLTQEFLLKGEPPPDCIPCNCPLTIKHLLIECADFNDVRRRFYRVPSLQDLFKTLKPEVILDLKAVEAFMNRLWLLETLTCSRREDDLSCRHMGLNHHSLTHCIPVIPVVISQRAISLHWK